MTGRHTPLLPDGVEVPFAEMGAALQRLQATTSRPAARILTATVVAVGPAARLHESAAALDAVAAGVRTVLIATGDNPSPPLRLSEQAVALEGLRPSYVNNALAALRLSSLPTLVWWRGGSLESLDGVAALADRLVFDVEEPDEVWARAGEVARQTAIGDLRWTRLTRWRALMAHFFDIPVVRDAAAAFDRLEIEAADPHAARLFAGWLASCLEWNGRVSIDIRRVAGYAPLERVRFGDSRQWLELRTAPSRTCVESSSSIDGHSTRRTVSLGNQDLPALVAEELRVRSRDVAFERAISALRGVA